MLALFLLKRARHAVDLLEELGARDRLWVVRSIAWARATGFQVVRSIAWARATGFQVVRSIA